MRDPRIDPRPGDVLRKQGKRSPLTRRVIAIRYWPLVRYIRVEQGKNEDCHFLDWKRWAESAEVVKVAE